MSGKIILLISPQPWDGLHISKHHYAVELSRHNKVFFLQPPNLNRKKQFNSTSFSDKLVIVDHRLNFPYALLFHFRFLFDLLMTLHVKVLLRYLNTKIDICWCFDGHVYSDLKPFNARISIYHPVDLFRSKNQKKIAASADIIFSVADNILENLKEVNVPKYFVNHGLCEEFSDMQAAAPNARQRIKVGYIGNITINSLDRNVVTNLIKHFSNVDFVFIGDHFKVKSEEIDSFMSEIKASKNVLLKPLMNKSELKRELNDIDVFLLCYNNEIDANSGSNSHKLLEYLSFGKVVVSSKVATYSEKYPESEALMIMMKSSNNALFEDEFKRAVENINDLNSIEKQAQRITFANQFTYEKQVKKIEEILIKEMLLT